MHKHKDDDDGLEEILEGDSSWYTLIQNKHSPHGAVHTLYIYNEIGEVKHYADLIEFISYELTSKDTLRMHICSPGGSVHTLSALTTALKRCAGRVIVHVDGSSYSAGAVLALQGHELHLNVGAFLMFHNYSDMGWGKGAELKASVDAVHSNFKRTIREWCSPFLTDKELDDIHKDKDVYVHYYDRDLKTRINRHFNKGKQ